ncbi:hypothetical protein HDU87_000906 [Geranomyces variabilis]|uniref:PEBP-like protein n=1 Tax=Geranomyces variabilis TaxID=109894 RepID=A0AAD5THB0_9FUNG|nr:hypothetical protein HDU87_000906 [Geranomyces variabilis]
MRHHQILTTAALVLLASLVCVAFGAPTAAIEHSVHRRALADDIAKTTVAIDRASAGLASILDQIAKAVGGGGGGGNGAAAGAGGTAGTAATQTQTAGKATATKTKGAKATGKHGAGKGAKKTKAVPPGQAKKATATVAPTGTFPGTLPATRTAGVEAPAPTPPTTTPATTSLPAAAGGAADVSAVKPALTKAGIIPDIIKDITPSIALGVTYPVAAVSLGNNITPAQAAAQPIFAFTPASATDLHTLLMVDPDVPSRASASPTAGQFRHMALLNIRGSDLTTALAASPYVGPAPPRGSGPHRYTFLLFKQTAEISAATAGIGAADRAGFKAQDFVDKNGLQLVGGNFMLSENP